MKVLTVKTLPSFEHLCNIAGHYLMHLRIVTAHTSCAMTKATEASASALDVFSVCSQGCPGVAACQQLTNAQCGCGQQGVNHHQFG